MTVAIWRMGSVASPARSAYRRPMRRLITLLWLTLSLAVASGPAFATPAVNCPMSGSSQMAGEHDKMDCCEVTCASECAAVCPAGVMTQAGRATALKQATEQNSWKPAEALPSARLTSTDPPPRTTIS